ncbi:unnamed protein product [Microthlaspi erraticum]|uniref:Methyltransferase type 11 domain-containing protein n=1 Tax=Microthlaspi erraticum TaxID=1685480 RepID=A0A6D2IRI0_9BRAS|nr:unnamed protein product [Microthlaspi erraticum]
MGFLFRTSDSTFYAAPRFVTHIDDPAIAELTKYYSKVLPQSETPGVSIVDMCSSWVLTEYIVQDLNVNPKLPFEDNSFQVITNVVRVDYLTKPLVVFKEMNRILKPGALVVMSFSNHCFFTKAISIWTSTGDADHALIVGSYFHYAGGFETPQMCIYIHVFINTPCIHKNKKELKDILSLTNNDAKTNVSYQCL